MLSFFLRFIMPKEILMLFPQIIVKIIFASIFVFWYYFCKNYFIKQENYKEVIVINDIKYKNKMLFVMRIGFLYSILTPLSFIVLAFILSNI